MKKIVIFVTICMVSSAAIIFILLAFRVRPYEGMNGFVRGDSLVVVKLLKEIDLRYTSFYFAGSTSNNIYLGNYNAAGGVFVADLSLNDTSWVNLSFDTAGRYAWEKARLSVDSPFIYLKEGISPVIFRGDLDKFRMKRVFGEASYFTSGLVISPQSMIVKTVSAKSKTHILAKVSVDSPYIFRNSNILTRQVDGIFCTDGTLVFDKSVNRIVYTYHYRNEFIELDTNLNVVFRGHTIDTNTIAKIEVSKVSSDKVFKFSAPPKYINLSTFANKNRLYVASTLLADNESRGLMKEVSIIDVYSLETGNYLNSVYVPLLERKRMLDFYIVDDKLYAIYEHTMRMYKM